MKVQIKVLNKEFYNKYNLPHYHTERSAAIDLFCTKNLLIPPQKSQVIYTGLAMWMGDSKIMLKEDIKAAALIIPRSGLGSRGLILRNLVGLIDEDYQGEIIVHMFNNSNDIVFINFSDCSIPALSLSNQIFTLSQFLTINCDICSVNDVPNKHKQFSTCPTRIALI